jgi:hypothetical protein
MKSKPIIYFDCDGVLLDSISAVCNLYVSQNKEKIASGELHYPNPLRVKKWNMSDQLIGATSKDMDRYFQSELFFNYASFIHDKDGFSMRDLFDELNADSRVRCMIATKGSINNLTNKRAFIAKEFPYFDVDKNFIGMEGTDFGKPLEGLAIIDDVLANLLCAKTKYKILFSNTGLDCEWNKDYVHYPDIIVCTSVNQLCNKIIELLKFEQII